MDKEMKEKFKLMHFDFMEYKKMREYTHEEFVNLVLNACSVPTFFILQRTCTIPRPPPRPHIPAAPAPSCDVKNR